MHKYFLVIFAWRLKSGGPKGSTFDHLSVKLAPPRTVATDSTAKTVQNADGPGLRHDHFCEWSKVCPAPRRVLEKP